MHRLIPRDEHFAELFAQFADHLLDAAQKLAALIEQYDRLEERIAEIRSIEHEADVVDREITLRLERTLVTPFDREDVHALSSRLDDVVDEIQAVAEAFVINGIDQPTPQAVALARVLSAAASQLHGALHRLDTFKGLEPHLKVVHELEHEADGLSRAAIATLFRGQTDAMFALRWREIYAGLEEAIDAMEDSGEVLERILTKR
jgi:uncharacterized protein